MSLRTGDGESKPPAMILRFPRKRGRPRISRPHRDTGTPELVMKRLKQETAEALDLCLERGIITLEQHWCGVHLRWLYTLRHGAPGVRAIDPTHLGGKETKTDDQEWRIAREAEFHEAMRKLMQGNCAAFVINLCIHNERPGFLRTRGTARNAAKHQREMTKIQEGLELLVRHWER